MKEVTWGDIMKTTNIVKGKDFRGNNRSEVESMKVRTVKIKRLRVGGWGSEEWKRRRGDGLIPCDTYEVAVNCNQNEVDSKSLRYYRALEGRLGLTVKYHACGLEKDGVQLKAQSLKEDLWTRRRISERDAVFNGNSDVTACVARVSIFSLSEILEWPETHKNWWNARFERE